MEVAVVTDSTADLSADILEENRITMVPLEVNFSDESYSDWVELKPKDFFKKLEAAETLPTTSQPALGKFIEVYEELGQKYDYILSIHISDKLSGTFKTANTASNMVEGVTVKVIDSKTVTIPLGATVMEVAKKAQQGYSVEELLELIERLKEEINIYFTVDELDYLEKGGRIGKAASFLGNLFKIRPLLTIEGGEIVPSKKIRGKKRLYNQFIKLAAESRTTRNNNLVIIYGRYREQAEILKDKLLTEYEWETVKIKRIGSVVGAHIGPTPFGMVIY